MDKKEYIKRQIARTNKKDYENYVVTRIIHKLDDLDIKFTTQQYVKRPEGCGLADLYFPQINYFIEVDEGHHLTNVEADKARDADFEDATGVAPIRIDVANSNIEQINNQIDIVVNEIKTLIQKEKDIGNFKEWNIEKEMNPDTWIEIGEIRIEDKVAFRKSVDWCKVIGLNYAGWQRGGATHPNEKDTLIWFPKLYPNGVWNNNYDEANGLIITERNIENQAARITHVNKCLRDKVQTRIVCARVKSMLGDVQYRFRGVFKLDAKQTNHENGVVWKRIATVMKTFDYKTS
tara:strand:- start:2607 stop:3479 length:873 start_codon:yes stop_codon:yes gene_type:complete